MPAAASQFDQGRREIETVNNTFRPRPALDLQRRPAAAALDIGEGCVWRLD
jgi:hypothetical protein